MRTMDPRETPHDAGGEVLLELRGVGKLRSWDSAAASGLAFLRILGLRARGVPGPAERWVVREASLQVRRGEALAILGASAGGCSTLAGLMAGLLLPDAGEVVRRAPAALLAAPTKGFKPIFRLEENMVFRAALLGVPRRAIRERCRAALDLAGLRGQERRRTGDLDPLLVRQAAWALALHLDAEVLILAGKLPAPDSEFGARFRAGLREIARERALVLLDERDEAAVELSGRVLLLVEGRLQTFPTKGEALVAFASLEAGASRALLDPEGAGLEDDDAGTEGEVLEEGAGEEPEEGEEGAARAAPAPAWAGKRGVLSRILLGGQEHHYETQSLLVWAGEALEVELEYRALASHSCRSVLVALHADGVRHPLAVHEVEVGGAPGAPRLLRPGGPPLRLRFRFRSPRLERGLYGLAASFLGPGETPAAGNTLKALRFFSMAGGEPRGSLHLGLEEVKVEPAPDDAAAALRASPGPPGP